MNHLLHWRLPLNYKIHLHLNKVVIANNINKSGYTPFINYIGEKDSDVEVLINIIKNIDPKYPFRLMIRTKISYTSEETKEIFKIIN